MNPVIEKLLLEIIYFEKNKKYNETDLYLKKATKKIDPKILFFKTRSLLSWIDPKMHRKDTDLKQYEIYEDFMEPEDFEETYGEFKLLFEHIPELSLLFQLKEKHIEFNSSLSKENIKEIYEFIEVNSTIRHINYYRPTND